MKYNGIVALLLISIISLVGCGSKEVVDKDLEEPSIQNKLEEKDKNEDINRSYGNDVNNFRGDIQVAEYNNKLYYSKKNQSGLYSMDIDSKESEKLNDDEAYCINIYKDRIYYINLMEKPRRIISLKLDGKSDLRVEAESANQLLIENDKLIYTVTGTEMQGKPGFNTLERVVRNLNDNTEIRTDIGYGSATIIDENTYIGFATSIQNYISRNDKHLFPNGNEFSPMINLIGVNDDYIMAKINDMKTYNDEIYFIDESGIPSKFAKSSEVMSSILVNDHFYYFSGMDFMDYSIKENKTTKLLEYNFNTAKMYVFDEIIYVLKGDRIISMYDTKENKVTETFKEYMNNDVIVNDKNVTANDRIPSSENAKEFLMSADSDYLKSVLEQGFQLNLVKETGSNEWENLAKTWSIPEEEFYHFSLFDGESGRYSYLIGRVSKNVYKLPRSRNQDAILMKDNKEVATFKYVGQ